jgi:hypothetical protein
MYEPANWGFLVQHLGNSCETLRQAARPVLGQRASWPPSTLGTKRSPATVAVFDFLPARMLVDFHYFCTGLAHVFDLQLGEPPSTKPFNRALLMSLTQFVDNQSSRYT